MGQTYSVPLICLMSHSSSTSIEIQNSGFESDVVGHDNTFLYGSDLLQPWELYDPMNIIHERITGVMNPTGGTSFNDPIYGDSPPEGTQNARLDLDDKIGAFGIVQTLTGNTVTAGTTYTLSAWVGNNKQNTWSTFSTEPSVSYDESASFPLYKVQLLADNNVLVEDFNQLSIEEGHWKQSVISITISPGDPHIGQTLAIRLYISKPNLLFIREVVCFDGIRLEATTMAPSLSPSMEPTVEPTVEPTNPSESPSTEPTVEPTNPSESPSTNPSETPSESPTAEPTIGPSGDPSNSPSGDPSNSPTGDPSTMPTASPTDNPVVGDDDSGASYITVAANMIIGMCLSLAVM